MSDLLSTQISFWLIKSAHFFWFILSYSNHGKDATQWKRSFWCTLEFYKWTLKETSHTSSTALKETTAERGIILRTTFEKMFRSTPHKCTHWESTSIFWLQFPYLQTAQDELAKTWQTLKSSCLHHFKHWIHQMWKLLIPSFSMPRFGLVSLTHVQALMLVETDHPAPRRQPQSFLMGWGGFWAWDGVLLITFLLQSWNTMTKTT